MTDLEAEGAHAWRVQARVLTAKETIYGAWVDLAGALFEMSVEQLYRRLGHDTFESWLAEVDLSRTWVYELVKVYREFVVVQGVSEERLKGLNPSKLEDVLSVVRRKALPMESILSDVETLSRGDLRERYRSGGQGTIQSANGSVPDDSTSYDAEREALIIRCPACGSRVREDQVRARD